MSEIALYNTLRKIPEVSEVEAKEAVADIANSKEVATKADIAELKAATKADIAELQAATKADIAKVDKTIAELKGELRADIERMGRIMLMWMAGIGLAIIGVIKYL